MPAGSVKPIAEIEIGPSKHEKFLDQNYKKVVLSVIAAVLVICSCIIYFVMQNETTREAGQELVSAFYHEGGYDIEGLEKIETEYNGRNAAITAGFMHAMALIKEGKGEEGKAALESFVNKVTDSDWKAHATVVLGSYYMQDGEMEKAVGCFEEAATQNSSVYSPVALLSLGDIARQNGDNEKAKEYYTQVEMRYKEGVSASMAVERLNLLGVSSPEKVTPPPTKAEPSNVSEGTTTLPEVFGLPGSAN